MGTLTLRPLPVRDQGFALGLHPVPSSSGAEDEAVESRSGEARGGSYLGRGLGGSQG